VLEHYWIIILFPLAGAAVSGFLGRFLSRQVISVTACSAIGVSFLVALFAGRELVKLPAGERFATVSLFTWIQSGSLTAEFAFLLDPLSLIMILVVTGVGFLIHIYSVEYMGDDPGSYRYFSYLNLFILMMSILVLADNYLLMFVGWEGVGLCSYLLIGFYLKRKSAGDAAKKAFIVNRVGDVAFLLGLFLIFSAFGTFRYLEVFQLVSLRFPEPTLGLGLLGVVTLLLFIGATGKSAQIPLYVWLPDAMEGPTPVSALIHAATMVTAGIYMIARSSALYSRAPDTLFLIALVGITTALVAALIALGQRDIKKVLAYSTISQLGYMFLALGVGAFGAGIFHLITHAFFKALLFLGAGSVILSLHHEQDLFRMGGLKRYLPITCLTMWIATLAISGAPLLAGFFSKDAILWEVWSRPGGSRLLWFVGVFVSGLTAFYMARLMFLAFHAASPETAGEDKSRALQEPSFLVKIPLLILAVLSIVAGYFGGWLESFLAPSFQHQLPATESSAHGLMEEGILALIVVLVAAGGFFLAYRFYLKDPAAPGRLSQQFPRFHRLLTQKFYLDELYETTLIRPVQKASEDYLWRWLDISIIDGLVNRSAQLAQAISQTVRRFQNGHVRTYAVWIFGGVIVICLYLSFQFS